MADDEKQAGESSTPEGEQQRDESLKTSEADTETSEGEESIKAIPYDRFKQVNDAKKQNERIVQWYRENVGDPNDVIEFRKWKSEQVKKAETAESEGEISPQKLAQIRALMRKADPEYAEMVERTKREQADRIEAQFDAAEETVRELAAEKLGLKAKTDESDIAWLAQQTMLAIQNDEKLMRMWQAGNLSCIKKGFEIVQERHDKLGKSISRMRQQAIDKRKVSKLPTLPSASGSLTGSNAKEREKGITKQTHDDAWAILNQSLQE
jgi:hypothetical protein